MGDHLAKTVNRSRSAVRGLGAASPSGGSSRPELERCARIATRLHAAFRALARSFPEQYSTVTEMSRFLGVGRGVCQRIALALRAEDDPLDILQRFPGLRGMEQFVDAAEVRELDSSHIAAARAALDEYAALIGAAGGSQRRLLASIANRKLREGAIPDSAGESHEAAPDDEEGRAALFHAAQRLIGARCTSRVEVLVLRVRRENPDELEMIEASVLANVTADASGLPITRIARASSSQGATESERAGLEPGSSVLGISPGAILEHFSSNPLPTVTSRLRSGDFIQVFNPDGRMDTPIDMAVATAMSPAAMHPRLDNPPIWNCGMVIAMPSRWLLMDVYLERPLAQACVPSMSVMRMGFNGPLGHKYPDDRWYDRFPDAPPVQLLGAGIARRGTRAYARASELASYLFERAGWNPERFLCVRCEVAFPVWDSQYVMTMDFSESGSPQPPGQT